MPETHFNDKIIRLDSKTSILGFLRNPLAAFAASLAALMDSPGEFALVVDDWFKPH